MELVQVGALDRSILDERHTQIQRVYLSDRRPWVIGFSGGKDSSTALQLIWYALSSLPPQRLNKPVYVISSDTLVETPNIVSYIDQTLVRINDAARMRGLPFSAHKVKPTQSKTFWVNLIGRGYPAPSKRFRWCTDRLKIEPANAFILDKVAEYGEVVMVLGVRKSESATRAQVMSLHEIKGTMLSRHSSLPNAFVYAPIQDFSVHDVWTYLLQVPSPWGNNNRDLVTMYRNAQAGECPLVIDKTTPSCGNSRFGCWVCTVVTRDSSMEAMIENGETWMEPLLEFRNFLASTQDPAVKSQVREHKRRNGKVMLKPDGGIIYGPYKMSVRKQLLKRLLEIQQQIRESGPDKEQTLITTDELQEIRRIWRTEEQDWEDSVARIFHEVMEEGFPVRDDEIPAFSSEERSILEEICHQKGVPGQLVAKLLDAERELHSMVRRSLVHQKISSILEEDWRSESEVLAAVSQ